jgi:hypothetical protein
MTEQTALRQPYWFEVYEPDNSSGEIVIYLRHRGIQHERGMGGAPKRVPEFRVTVRQDAHGPVFDWSNTPDDPGAARDNIQEDITKRLKDRAIWIDRVNALVREVEQWAKELNWSTRHVEKKLDDIWIGKHKVPALLMQEDTFRILLEPISPSAPGVQGVVDLYLMPAYDDVAVLYFYRDRWNIHHNTGHGKNAVVPVREAEAMPLTKETLEEVLAELRQNVS